MPLFLHDMVCLACGEMLDTPITSWREKGRKKSKGRSPKCSQTLFLSLLNEPLDTRGGSERQLHRGVPLFSDTARWPVLFTKDYW